MSLLTDLTTAIRDGGIKVIDLTAPLNDTTPVIRLPEPFGAGAAGRARRRGGDGPRRAGRPG